MEFTIHDISYNLQDTIEGGQMFRYQKTSGYHYVVYSADKRCTIDRCGDVLYVYEKNAPSEDEVYWRNYFNFE